MLQALPETLQCQAADLPNMQLVSESGTLQTALGLGGENVLAQFQRNLVDQSGQSSPELGAILAASLGMLPVNSTQSVFHQTESFCRWDKQIASLHRVRLPSVSMRWRVLREG